MSDTSLNRFVGEGDDAQEAAFTPSPPTPASGPDSACLFVNKEAPASPILKWWDGSAFQPVGGGGANAVTAAGTLTSNALAIGQGSKAVAVTTTGANVLTALGVAVGSAGAFVVNGGALGTPTSGVGTNLTGIPTSALTGTVAVVNGGTGATNGAAILRSSTTIANADILTLPSTPVVVLAAPGSGFFYNVIGYMLRAKFATAAYTGVNAAAFMNIGAFDGGGTILASGYIFNDAGTTPASTKLTTLFGATNFKTQLIPFLQDYDPTSDEWGLQPTLSATGDLDNASLRLEFNNNGGGNLGGGNAANSLVVTVFYTLEAI